MNNIKPNKPPLNLPIHLIYDAKSHSYLNCYPSAKGYQAIINCRGICLYLGRFGTQDEAARCALWWYIKNYHGLWERVITRSQDGGKNCWTIEKKSYKKGKLKGNPGYIATVWVNGRGVEVTSKLVKPFEPCYIDGMWTSHEAAKYAKDYVIARFQTMKLRRMVLFRI